MFKTLSLIIPFPYLRPRTSSSGIRSSNSTGYKIFYYGFPMQLQSLNTITFVNYSVRIFYQDFNYDILKIMKRSIEINLKRKKDLVN